MIRYITIAVQTWDKNKPQAGEEFDAGSKHGRDGVDCHGAITLTN